MYDPFEDAEKRGEAQGRAIGEARGEARFAKLLQKLYSLGRAEDVQIILCEYIDQKKLHSK